VGRDRTLSSQLPQRVSVHAEVPGGVASIQPRVVLVGPLSVIARHQAIDDQVGATAQELINESAV
jgi:hypothetical protein